MRIRVTGYQKLKEQMMTEQEFKDNWSDKFEELRKDQHVLFETDKGNIVKADMLFEYTATLEFKVEAKNDLEARAKAEQELMQNGLKKMNVQPAY